MSWKNRRRNNIKPVCSWKQGNKKLMAFSPVVLLQKILGLETMSLGSLKIQHRDRERTRNHGGNVSGVILKWNPKKSQNQWQLALWIVKVFHPNHSKCSVSLLSISPFVEAGKESKEWKIKKRDRSCNFFLICCLVISLRRNRNGLPFHLFSWP